MKFASKPPEVPGRGMEQHLSHSPQKEPTLPAPLSRTYSLQNGDTINFCFSKTPVCDALLRQAWQANTPGTGLHDCGAD